MASITVRLLLLSALLAVASRAETLDLDSFAYPDSAAATQAWRAIPPSPAAVSSTNGLVFPCPFDQPTDRVCWDQTGPLDLSGWSSFELEVSGEDPEALRALSLYFKSGPGWYVCARGLKTSGRQQLVYPKADFTTEGRPAGWDRIEAIRLSPWKGAPVRTELVAHALRARKDTILLVRADTSAPDETERSFSKHVTLRVSRWLSDLCVPHGVVSDAALTPDGLRDAKVVFLCYSPNPSAAQIAALRALAERGGKLIVCYSQSEALADLAGVRLGPYQKAETRGRWSSFSFAETPDWTGPPRVAQESLNVRPAYPAGTNDEVIAWWCDRDRNRTEIPAWVRTERGFWMSHVLLEGDARNKRRMLVELLGRLEPDIWPAAARRAAEQSAAVDSFRTFEQVETGLREQARATGTEAALADLLQRAGERRADMQAHCDAGRYGEALREADALFDALVAAYATVQAPKSGELRGVWDHSGAGWYPGDWERSARLLAGHGMTAVFPNFLWAGLAHYPSEVVPISGTCRRYGDQVRACVDAAQEFGLEVHAWMVCWNLGNTPPEFRERMRREGRLQREADGSALPWLCPSHPDNVRMALDSLKEIAGRYPIAGVHLDYIRYPGANACYCPTTRAAFEKELGREAAGWPESAAPGGALAGEFQRFRVGEITRFVRAVHEEVRPLRPGLRVSAAVFSLYPECVKSVAQDWAGWLKEGLVDFVCPMNYTPDAGTFASMTARQIALDPDQRRIVPGLGVTSNESELGPDGVIEQILAAREAGAGGFMLFSLSETLRDEILPVLKLGPTKP